MYAQNWVDVLQGSFNNLLTATVNFIPNFVVAVIVFLVGWFIAEWVGWAVAEAIKALRVDHALRAAGVEDVVNRAGYRLDSGRFLGALVKWFVIIVVLVAALQVLNLAVVTTFVVSGLLPYIPHVIAAAIIILVAALIAQVAEAVVAGAARAAGVVAAGFAGTVARWAIWIFAILSALDQLEVTPFVQQLFTGIVIALALAFGLAFGLGGQEAAARWIERVREGMHKR
ncbi:MAG: hypothetical protein KGI70_00965 [Patescibacteria group bacterium]|nr:hypothetical protein [Patescibacteria group bacterium]